MRITKLDGLRGIFSLMIVFFHYSEKFLPDFIYTNFFIRQSYTFVDFFFVLSGFVIAYNYNTLNTKKEFWVFLKKRFIRLYPLLFYTTVVFFFYMIVLVIFRPEYYNNIDFIVNLCYKTVDTLLFLNATPVFSSTYLGLNEPSWSIASEMISYIVFGIVSLVYIGNKKTCIYY